MPVNINNNEQQYKRPGVGAIIGGAFAGGMVNNLISMPHRLMAPKIMDKLGDISRNLSPEDLPGVKEIMGVLLGSQWLIYTTAYWRRNGNN